MELNQLPRNYSNKYFSGMHLMGHRSASGYGVLQLTVAVLLLSIMALLFANVTTMYLAKNYNTQVCMNAAYAGKQAATSGANENEVAHIVEQTVNQSCYGGYFVSPPELHGLAFHKIDGADCLVVNTVIQTRVPAPLLIPYADWKDNGQVYFSKTCVIPLNINHKNPS